MGVPIQSSLVYVPCRSGSPQGVFAVKTLAGAVLTAGAGGAVFGAAGDGAICAGPVWPAIEIDASAITVASIATNVESRFIVSSLLLYRDRTPYCRKWIQYDGMLVRNTPISQ